MKHLCFLYVFVTVLNNVFSQESKPYERYLGHTGVLTCNYTEPNAGYISVEWRYSATGYDWSTASTVYSYGPRINSTGAGHLTNRSNHSHEPEQIKLFIYDLQDTDAGNYFCQIVGATPLRDNITFQPISEFHIFIKLRNIQVKVLPTYMYK